MTRIVNPAAFLRVTSSSMNYTTRGNEEMLPCYLCFTDDRICSPVFPVHSRQATSPRMGWVHWSTADFERNWHHFERITTKCATLCCGLTHTVQFDTVWAMPCSRKQSVLLELFISSNQTKHITRDWPRAILRAIKRCVGSSAAVMVNVWDVYEIIGRYCRSGRGQSSSSSFQPFRVEHCCSYNAM